MTLIQVPNSSFISCKPGLSTPYSSLSRNMRLVLVLFYLLTGTVHAQTLSDFGKIPNTIDQSIATEELLTQLDWKSIQNFCQKKEGFYAHKKENGLLTEYEYVKQGRVESFQIISYKEKVLEFYFDVPEKKRSNEYFFDKELWLNYVQEVIPGIPDTLILTKNEPADLLKGYYALLGVNATDEYGWICEYSAVGMPPKRRLGVIELIKHNRIDLLRKLKSHSNAQIKLYAIDALIYLKKFSNVLSENDWKEIYKFRDSQTMIRTCGNMGSYKIYETPIADLLSKKAIKQIPNKYKSLEKLGYLLK